MKHQRNRISILLVLALAAPARADDDVVVLPEVEALPETPTLPPPDEEPKGRPQLVLGLTFQLGLYAGAAGDPLSLAPDLWLDLPGRGPGFGLVHSSEAITGFHGLAPVSSLCLRGDTCDAVGTYQQVGLLTRIPLWAAESASQIHIGGIAVEAGPVVRSFDPSFGIDFKVGAGFVYGKAIRGIPIPIRWIFEAWPSVLVSATDRETKRDQLNIPVTISLERGLGIQTGLSAPLSGFGDGYQVPLGAFIAYPITDWLTASLAFTLPAVVGGDAVPATGWDARVLTFNLTVSRGL